MRRLLAAAVALCAAAPAPVAAQEGSKFRPAVSGTGGVVATESTAAGRVGRDVLRAGGNAVDAAAATVFALGVARPQSCGLGGGGFAVYRSASGRVRALDFRETAPAAFRPDTLQPDGLHKRFTGHLTVGVPGTLAGLDALLARYGTLKLDDALAPAERLARRGFRVPQSLAKATQANAERLALFPASKATFLPGGKPIEAGDTFRQPELGASLRMIARVGPDAFYRGTIARRIINDMHAPRATNDPGLMTLDDLDAYRPVWRRPLTGIFRDARVHVMPPPTSGGVALLEMLSILAGDDLRAMGRNSADTVHLVAEAQKIAFADRARYLADPDFVRQPSGVLTSAEYGLRRRGEIDMTRASSYSAGDVTSHTGTTTHVSVIDRRGGAVALTCTIEQEFGSAVIAPGTGILLNNELTDFGAPGTANEPAGGKRPRSSMSPTIVVRGGRPVLVTGAAGGVRIIMGVVHAVLDVVEHGRTIAQAADAPRYDTLGGASLEIEDVRFDPAVRAELHRRGHRIVALGEYGPRPRMTAAGMTSDEIAEAVTDARTDAGAQAVP